MMCYETGTLQAFLDGEISGGKQQEIKKHLLECGACRTALEELRDNQRFTDSRLSGYLHHLSRAGINTGAAWQRFSNSRGLTQHNFKARKGVLHMLSRYRGVASAAVIVLAVAIALSFSSVRSMASELLTVFRVEKVQTISISPDDMADIERAFRSGAGQVDIENFGKLEFTGKQSSSKVSLSEARAAADFELRLPETLPDGYSLKDITINSAGDLNMTLNTVNTNQVLKSLGSEKLLPDELNGKTFTVKVPVAVYTRYAGPGDTCISVLQSRSPELIADGSDVSVIRDALLALPFLPENLRGQLASINDWQHTFLVPNIDGTSQDVQVAGSQGVFITPPAEAKEHRDGTPPSNLIWQKDGVVYGVSGPLSLEQAQAIAASMQ